MKVLIAENEKQTLNLLNEILSKEGFHTIVANDGHEALSLYQSQKPDFMCLDIMMPGLTGYDVCEEIRKIDTNIPIIFISAKSEAEDTIKGLQSGADDYIVRPFNILEVITRIRTVARRCIALKPESSPTTSETFNLGDLEVTPSALRAKRGDNIIDLSLRDSKILTLLHEHRNQIVDRNLLLDTCWGEHIMPESRTVDWHISQLRKRVEKDPKDPKIIQTVHGIGYKFEEDNV